MDQSFLCVRGDGVQPGKAKDNLVQKLGGQSSCLHVHVARCSDGRKDGPHADIVLSGLYLNVCLLKPDHFEAQFPSFQNWGSLFSVRSTPY